MNEELIKHERECARRYTEVCERLTSLETKVGMLLWMGGVIVVAVVGHIVASLSDVI